ncbi:MAG: hypothetical protein U9O96_01340 [Candidatus Thermoplasmatota archaeon]|nr:hypothetical protein [Candidatus Thermoplasmatota archaeon]
MEWIKCVCGNEEFKITPAGIAYCSKCMQPLEQEIRIPTRRATPDMPDYKGPEHPDIPGPLKF